jgi:cell fate (sporulation/competence/biofilm development) regulator YlbF (YheA/YmcA/DUF963 family)
LEKIGKKKIDHDEFLLVLKELKKLEPAIINTTGKRKVVTFYKLAADSLKIIKEHGEWFEAYIKRVREMSRLASQTAGRKREPLETISAYAKLRRDYRQLKREGQKLTWDEFIKLPETQRYINNRSTVELNRDRAT